MVDTSLIDSSRDYEASRYFDLVRVVEHFYSDGMISDAELKDMREIRSETLINYQVAADMLHKMDPKAAEYGKLKELVDYLRKCWVLMDYATDKGVVVNHEQEMEKQRESITLNKTQKKSLDLEIDGVAKELVSALKTPEQRREANAEEISRAVAQMPREVKEKAAQEIVRSLQEMKQQDLMLARRRLLEIERSRTA